MKPGRAAASALVGFAAVLLLARVAPAVLHSARFWIWMVAVTAVGLIVFYLWPKKK